MAAMKLGRGWEFRMIMYGKTHQTNGGIRKTAPNRELYPFLRCHLDDECNNLNTAGDDH